MDGMNRKKSQAQKKSKIKESQRDPNYASARPWDWKLCLDCGALIPRRCQKCGGAYFSERPVDIIEAALAQHGYPPGLHK